MEDSAAWDLESEQASMQQSMEQSATTTTTTTTAISSKPHKANDAAWEAIQAAEAAVEGEGGVCLDNFELLGRLGTGDIGIVYLARLRGGHDGSSLFAIKVTDKRTLATRNKLERAQTEKTILSTLDHPFLPTLYAHFETPQFSCLVMDYCPGGDLHSLRRRQPAKCFESDAARFYAAEVLLALEYLHMMGVVYRDLKPENVLVREDGHLMLSDFDLSLVCDANPTVQMTPRLRAQPRLTAVVTCHRILPSCVAPWRRRVGKPSVAAAVAPLPELVVEPTEARSMSFVGTHEYLAPEIVAGFGHGAAVDWWTFGIFLYELLYGYTPFRGHDNQSTLVNVLTKRLEFPDMGSTGGEAARSLIRGLLAKDPRKRIASSRGACEIKQHPFFAGVNWALIRCAVPPRIPDDAPTDSFVVVASNSSGDFDRYF